MIVEIWLLIANNAMKLQCKTVYILRVLLQNRSHSFPSNLMCTDTTIFGSIMISSPCCQHQGTDSGILHHSNLLAIAKFFVVSVKMEFNTIWDGKSWDTVIPRQLQNSILSLGFSLQGCWISLGLGTYCHSPSPHIELHPWCSQLMLLLCRELNLCRSVVGCQASFSAFSTFCMKDG